MERMISNPAIENQVSKGKPGLAGLPGLYPLSSYGYILDGIALTALTALTEHQK